jgi:hypothetical protein
MEQVPNSAGHEDGMYLKSAVAEMLTMRMQLRVGVINAANQGVPQVRCCGATSAVGRAFACFAGRSRPSC